jgi:hypothetical protein
MRYELTDHEWAAIRPMLPNKAPGRTTGERPVWVLRSGRLGGTPTLLVRTIRLPERLYVVS